MVPPRVPVSRANSNSGDNAPLKYCNNSHLVAGWLLSVGFFFLLFLLIISDDHKFHVLFKAKEKNENCFLKNIFSKKKKNLRCVRAMSPE